MIGRDALLAELVVRLRAGEDIGVHGLPGMGKTTLAAAIANAPDILRHFSDGVLWAGLGAAGDAFSALGAWLVALGTPQGELFYLKTNEARKQAAHAAIGLRRMLIVIDDAWATDVAVALRVGGPNCAHLFTSRFPQVADEAVGTSTPLPALGDDDVARVLTQLAPVAAAQRPDSLRELEAFAGGLPLALTLIGHALRAAERGSPRRLETVLADLHTAEARLKLKLVDARLSERKASTLREIIALSERVLDEPTCRALHALSVFPPKPNTFSEEAALAVAECTTDELDALVDNGLIEVIDRRYSIHTVMRDYGQECLHDDRPRLYRRMAEHYINVVLRQPKPVELLDEDAANITTALDAVFSHELPMNIVNGIEAYLHLVYDDMTTSKVNGRLRAARQRKQQMLRSDDASDSFDHIVAWLNIGRLYFARQAYTQLMRVAAKTQHDLSQSQRLADDLRFLEQILAHPLLACYALGYAGRYYFRRKRFERARQLFSEQHKLAEAVGAKQFAQMAHEWLKKVESETDSYSQASTEMGP